MADNVDTDREKRSKRGQWDPWFLFWTALLGVAVFVGVLAASGAFASDSPGVRQAALEGSLPSVAAGDAAFSDNTLTSDTNSDPGVASTPADSPGVVVASFAPAPGESGESHGASELDVKSSSAVASPTPVASSMTQSPVFVPPAPAAPLNEPAYELVGYAGSELGIEIVTDGQDWGDTDAEQIANVGVVISAWQRLPLQVTSSILEHPHDTLKVLSNRQGRTAGGWQPYGDTATSFYTNSDQGVEGYRVSNQIVLASGAGEETVLHEMLHAYALRNVPADEYVSVFLGEEMRSFMNAAGWRMLVSDEKLRANAHEPWDVVNGMFAYEGPGEPHGSNPLEAFASAGAQYYMSGGSIGGCAAFAWFEENLAASS